MVLFTMTILAVVILFRVYHDLADNTERTIALLTIIGSLWGEVLILALITWGVRKLTLPVMPRPPDRYDLPDILGF
jgi:hypothetical protein